MHVLRAASIAHTTQLIRFGDLGWRDPGSAGTIVLCQVVYKELRRGSATFLLLPAGNANLLAWLNGGNLSGEGVGLLVAPIPELEPVGAGDGASAEGVVAMVNRRLRLTSDMDRQRTALINECQTAESLMGPGFVSTSRLVVRFPKPPPVMDFPELP